MKAKFKMRSTETTETMSVHKSELQIIHKNKVYTKRNLKKKKQLKKQL